MSTRCCARSTGLFLLFPFLILASVSPTPAQGTIVAGARATVVVQSGPSVCTGGLIVASPASMVVLLQAQPAAPAAPAPKPQPKTAMILTRKEYEAKKDPDKLPADPMAAAMTWTTGTLTGLSDPLDLGNNVAVSKVVSIIFDDVKGKPAAVTYASGDGKKLYTRWWKPAPDLKLKFKEKDDTTIYTYDAGDIKSIFFIVPAIPSQQPAQ